MKIEKSLFFSGLVFAFSLSAYGSSSLVRNVCVKNARVLSALSPHYIGVASLPIQRDFTSNSRSQNFESGYKKIPQLNFQSIRQHHEAARSRCSVNIDKYTSDESSFHSVMAQLDELIASNARVKEDSSYYYRFLNYKTTGIIQDLMKHKDNVDRYGSAVEALEQYAVLREVEEKVPGAGKMIFQNYQNRGHDPHSPFSNLDASDKDLVYQSGIVFNNVMEMIKFSLDRTGYYTVEENIKEIEKIARESTSLLKENSEITQGGLSDIALLSYHLDTAMDKASSEHNIASTALAATFISSFAVWNFVPGANEMVLDVMPSLANQAWDAVEGPLTFSMFIKMIYDVKTKKFGTLFKKNRAEKVMDGMIGSRKGF